MLYRTFPQEHASWASYQILERRSNLGGTWDFFKYPGIRSDSDMFTFGFSWKIWKSAEPIATGEAIMAYLKEAAEEQGLMEKIRFNTDISSAGWSSVDNKWHLVTKSGAKFTCEQAAQSSTPSSLLSILLSSSRPSPADPVFNIL